MPICTGGCQECKCKDAVINYLKPMHDKSYKVWILIDPSIPKTDDRPIKRHARSATATTQKIRHTWCHLDT